MLLCLYIPSRVSTGPGKLSNPENCTFGFVEWPEPAGVNVAMTRGINKGISISIVDLRRIDIISHISCSNFTAFDNRFLRSWDECIYDFVGDLSGRVRFLFVVWVRQTSISRQSRWNKECTHESPGNSREASPRIQ